MFTFALYTSGKGMNFLIPLFMSSTVQLVPIYKDGFDVKYSAKVDMRNWIKHDHYYDSLTHVAGSDQ